MRVLVAGDVVTDHYVYEDPAPNPGSSNPARARWFSEPGGAALVANLLRTIAICDVPGETRPRFRVETPQAGTPGGAPVREGFCVVRLCDHGADPRRKVWRVTQALGFSPVAVAGEPVLTISSPLDEPADVVVLDDGGLGFRRWPSRAAWPKFLREPGQDLPDWIVLKMSGPIAAGDLWHTIVSDHTQPDGQPGSPPPVHLGDLGTRTLLVLSVDDLRRESVRIDGKLSWEQASADLVQDLETSPRLQALKKLRFVVVRFGLDGAVIVDRSRQAEPRHLLVFDPAGIEGAFVAGVSGGRVFGYQSCLTAAIVMRLLEVARDAPAQALGEAVVAGVRNGLNGMRRLALDGYEPDDQRDPPTSFPFARIAQEIRSATPHWPLGSVALPPGLGRSTAWTIIGGAAADPPSPLWGLARRVAVHGIRPLTGIPYLQFAKLYSVDRSEIESFRTLQRLLTSYRHDDRASKPLSIAAFGPPGSGKSFGVKQLAEALFADKDPLEFNLSQFSTAGELHDLFHQIRDRVLRGKLPMVFWDEFDSRNLDWLQYLLAPMQDGTFQAGQVTHPIGKCVFVFAGGTRHRFEDFGEPPTQLREAQDEAAIQRWRDDFAMKKGTDFKSRLAGHINVLGPNPRDNQDLTYPIRRALLLRVHLGLKPAAKADLDPGLLDAFLRIGRYRHGARSLEKIAEQVRLSAGNGAFTRSDLPPRQQIDLHVNADEFLDIVEGA